MTAAAKERKLRLRVRVICEGIPEHQFEGCDGRRRIWANLQTQDGHQPGIPSGNGAVAFATEIDLKSGIDGTPDFKGEAVYGKRGERFFYLSWSGEKNGRREMFRRIKIHLCDVTKTQLDRAVRTSGALVARVQAVSKDGGPACASVPLLGGGWSVEKT